MTFFKRVPHAIAPSKKYPEDAGFDLSSVSLKDRVLRPGERMLIETGLSIRCPPGTYGRIAPRSGLASEFGIDVLAGVIDPRYTGEIKVCLINLSNENFVVEGGTRIAQIIFEKIECPPTMREVEFFEEIAGPSVDEPSARGEGGFGSTGNK